MNRSRATAAAMLACLAGCGSHPTLKAQGDSGRQTQWEQVPHGVATSGNLSDQPWWSVFHDPVLDRLMSLGLENNLDLQQARARILQARAQSLGAKAALW